MSTSVSKVKLSASTDGRPIKVTATSSPGTTIHTATSTSGAVDRIFVYAFNTSASTVALTMQLGGTTSPDDELKVSIPGQSGSVLVVAGWLYDNGAVLRAYAATANVINITGEVERIVVT